MTKSKKRVALEDALEQLGLGFEGRPHDGLDDAVNTARLLVEMMRRIHPVFQLGD